jgi:hypothetical protein
VNGWCASCCDGDVPPGIEWRTVVYGMRVAVIDVTGLGPAVSAAVRATEIPLESHVLEDAAKAALAQKLCPHVVVDGVPGPVPAGVELT